MLQPLHHIQSKQMTVIAVVVSRGGLGDCGQHAIAQAISTGIHVRAIARLQDTIGLVEDKPFLSKEQLANAQLTCHAVDFAADGSDTVARLEDVLEGVDAVVACPGNRQSKMERTAAKGIANITTAMQKKGVTRLVFLSSCGLHSKPMPWTWVGTLYGVLLATAFRGARNDLRAADATVLASSLDYVIVRPMGLDPKEPPRGTWRLLADNDTKGPLALCVAKADVGKFLLSEAINGSVHREAVQIGQPLAEAAGTK
jgi:nucleoside-diphosphate-sugar epimerase